ncbi:MAG: transcriptional regulator [Acidimicrobiia bacterium]|nr:transcriptional regulator [Acidimicrobiia bacterium]
MPDLPPPIDPDRLIHEPGRLAVLAVLNAVEEADFQFLLQQTGLTRGNLSSHTSKLEVAGYVEIEKAFVGKVPRTVYRLAEPGRAALDDYRAHMTDVLGAMD